MIVFDLPKPPTTNTLYANVAGRGRVKSKRYLTWLRAAGTELMRARSPMTPKSVQGPVELSMALGRDRNKDGSLSRRKQDISNRVKALEDLLVQHGVIQDDSLVEDLRIHYSDEVQPRRIRVTIQSARERDVA